MLRVSIPFLRSTYSSCCVISIIIRLSDFFETIFIDPVIATYPGLRKDFLLFHTIVLRERESCKLKIGHSKESMVLIAVALVNCMPDTFVGC